MTKRNHPLPSPPGRRFGPGGALPEEGPGTGLLEERLAQAAAMGKLEEFMDAELPDSEHARKLASMMMGMTGMAPSAGRPAVKERSEETKKQNDPAGPPEDIVQAVKAGDIGELMGLLAREHEKRTSPKSPSKGKPEKQKKGKGRSPERKVPPGDASTPFDRETLDALVAIAKENSVSVDWLMARAIKLYIRDYKTTGRM